MDVGSFKVKGKVGVEVLKSSKCSPNPSAGGEGLLILSKYKAGGVVCPIGVYVCSNAARKTGILVGIFSAFT